MSGRPETTSVIPGKYVLSVGRANMPSPPGWRWVKLTDVARLETGHTPSRNHPEYWDGGIPWIGIKDARAHHGKTICDTLQKVSELGLDNSAARQLPTGTVCLSRTASVGYALIMGREMATSQDFVNWVCSEVLTPRYLMYAMLAERDSLPRFGKGTTHTTIYFPEVKGFQICLPPLNEQLRIVAKIEELFSDLDAGVAALERAKANLKRYRASVLKAAVDGSLTAEWRANHPNVEPASKLLARILAERRRKWEADQLAKFAAAGTVPPRNWQEKYIGPFPPDASNLRELPDGWCWASVEQVGEVQGGIQKQPKRAPASNAFPYLRVANVHRDRLELTEVHKIELFADELERLRLECGDMLIVEGNGSKSEIGRSAIWRGEIDNCVHQNHIIRVRFLAGESCFLNVYWNSPRGNARVTAMAASTSGLYTLSVAKTRSLPVPLPPLNEQHEIVKGVEGTISQIEAAELAIDHGLKRAARLRQSILKDAFEGKLVAQDPADEPASVLLARIQQNPMAATPEVRDEFHRPRTLPKEVFLRRASVVSYTVRRLAAHRSFGRTQLEKTIHLTQCHFGVDLGFVFERYAAGPFDKDIYKLEAIARKKDWFTTQDRPKYGVTYHPGTKIDDMCRYATGCLGPKQGDLDRLLEHIAGMNTDQAELFATAYAAWNDLLIDGRPADDDAIIAEIHGWHPQKAKFTPQMIRSIIQWMRKHGYVPTGRGKRTQVAPKCVHLPSKKERARS